MGWAALAFFALAVALSGFAWQIGTKPASADEQLGLLIYVALGVASFAVAILLWVLWVSFG